MFRRTDPCFFAFDLLTCEGQDLRSQSLLDRKRELRRLLAKTSPPFPLRYVEHVEGSGIALFEPGGQRLFARPMALPDALKRASG